MIRKEKIAIVTTVVNFELYKKTATLFPKEIDKIVIDGTLGMYGLNSINYMFEKLKFRHYDWIIMADEDVFFYNAEKVITTIEYMAENDYDVAGVRDGGVIKHRFDNPMAMNTFFTILNFKKISAVYKFEEVISCQKIYPELYSKVLNLPYEYNNASLKEPYYCFYFWLQLKGFKLLFLDTINPVGIDETANDILSSDGERIAMHSWYARAYQVYEDQTVRINQFIKDFQIDSELDLKEVKIYKKYFFNFKKNVKKYIKSILCK